MRAKFGSLALGLWLVSLAHGQIKLPEEFRKQCQQIKLEIKGEVLRYVKFGPKVVPGHAVVTTKPLRVPPNAEGAREVSDLLNSHVNAAFGKTVAIKKNDSQVYSWKTGKLVCVCHTIHIGNKYFSTVEIWESTKGKALPPMPNDPKSKPMQ